MNPAVSEASSSSFFARNEFLLRRLHSLTGLVPVGAYMCVHLLTNARILDSVGAFQSSVYMIHSLGRVLPVIEWGFIFLPLLFHAIFGFLIINGSRANQSTYNYSANWRYTLQRASGMIAAVFIFYHVFHMHGWFHADWYLHSVAEPLGGAQFRAYNAGSTAAEAIQRGAPLMAIFYAVGILACVFHLANGIWTFGITWGIWVTPAAQRWATVAALVFGLGLSAVGLGALGGFATTDPKKAAEVEKTMYEAKLKSGEIEANPHKITTPKAATEHAAAPQSAASPAAAGHP
ncbi:MAG: succinate dehydrogenase cytochrome b558 subunit [Pirellulaceae bacterium]|nr:succinate dehydrogenase cytochrome b558 subunit [Pirellulaceae bacterium]